MLLRRFLARAQAALRCTQAALQSLSREQRQARKAIADEKRHVAELASPLPALRGVEEEREVLAMGELVHAWRTGEVPIVAEIVDEFRLRAFTYPEPIGPRLPTLDERFAAFEADPLTAPLPTLPAKTNPHFAEALAAADMDRRVVEDLETTGPIDRGFLAALARGER